MKQNLIISIVTFVMLFLTYSGAMALPFSSTGVINPDYNDSWNEETLTGIARIEITIDEAWPQVIEVDLEFESDIFDLVALDAGDFTVASPTNWSTIIHQGTNGYEFSVSTTRTDPATSANDPIVIEFTYTLLDADMFANPSEGVVGGWDWDEGQAWAISYYLYGYGFIEPGVFSMATSGGSISPVPEPASMILLGTGLLVLAGAGRKKIKRKTRFSDD